ncbi:MAG: hypothetical protein H6744_03270 [Deltaproteobacteria bacterium]|nr:hypothetical protein [Deltaproteobacteria bacterium]MCB9785696.1 hypothetical protein [Deltaproteobacteria bacterium]
MAVSIQWDPDAGIVRLRARGEVSGHDVVDAMRAFAGACPFGFGRARAWLNDYREARLDGMTDEVARQIEEISVGLSKVNPTLVVAHIVPERADGEVSWEAHIGESGWLMRTFRSEEHAQAWVSMMAPEATKEELH